MGDRSVTGMFGGIPGSAQVFFLMKFPPRFNENGIKSNSGSEKPKMDHYRESARDVTGGGMRQKSDYRGEKKRRRSRNSVFL